MHTALRQAGHLLATHPFITTTGVADRLGLAFTTAQRAIERLERNDVVQQATDAKPSRVYCVRALIEMRDAI